MTADENIRLFGEEIDLKYQKPRTMSSAVERKVLAEKNNGSSSPTHFGITVQAKPEVNLRGGGVEVCSNPYDPMTNYTSPRPQFLRYNPNRRREIFMRIEGEKSNEEDESGGSSILSPKPEKPGAEGPLSIPPNCSQPSVEEGGGVAEIDMDEEEDVEMRPRCLKTAWNLFLIVVLLSSNYYFSSMRPGSGPSLHDLGGDSMEKFTKAQRDQIILTGILMAKIFGLSEVCFNVPGKELTCGVEDGLQEHESIPGIENLIEGATGQLLIEENIHEAVSFTEQQSHEISDPHPNQTVNSPLLLSDTFQASAIESVSVDSSNDQNGIFHLEEEAQGMNGSVSDESLWFPRFQTYSRVISDIPKIEENEAERNFLFSSQNAPHMLLSVYLLASSLGYFLHKYFQGYRQISKPPSTSSLSVDRKKSMLSAAREKKQIEDKINSHGVCSVPQSCPSNLVNEEITSTLPTAMQSTGKFIVSERTAERIVDSAEKSALFQYSRRPTMSNYLPFAKEELPSVIKAIPPSQKEPIQENSGVRKEAMKMTPTPLRRSSRLQSRVTSTLR